MEKQVKDTAPAGLMDDRIEWFILEGEPVYLREGRIVAFSDRTEDVDDIITEQIKGDRMAQKGLERLGITDPVEAKRRFVFCRFGGYDNKPDIVPVEDGVTINPEYWECGLRPCLADGLLCRPSTPSRQLTLHDIQLIRLIGQDLPVKAIAEKMGTAESTVNRQCQHLCHKLNCSTQKGIARYAGENNLI